MLALRAMFCVHKSLKLLRPYTLDCSIPEGPLKCCRAVDDSDSLPLRLASPGFHPVLGISSGVQRLDPLPVTSLAAVELQAARIS